MFHQMPVPITVTPPRKRDFVIFLLVVKKLALHPGGKGLAPDHQIGIVGMYAAAVVEVGGAHQRPNAASDRGLGVLQYVPAIEDEALVFNLPAPDS